MIAACVRGEVVASSEPEATSGPSNGWVAFAAVPGEVSTAGQNGPADIYLVREGEVVQLAIGSVGDGRHQFCPAFSPDGSRLAYVDLAHGRDVDLPHGPDASPRPSRIVISDFDGDGSLLGLGTVFELGHPDAGEFPRRGMSCPKWSPDGSMLAYIDLEGGAGIRVATLGGEQPSVLCCPCALGNDCGISELAWAPDGSVIAVDGPDGLALIPLDGGEWRPLRGFQPNESIWGISWSRDGTELVAVMDDDVQLLVKVIRLDGNEYDLSSEALSPSTEPGSLIWSPDGSRIAYVNHTSTQTLVVSSPDGIVKKEIRVPDPNWPIWSPDGTRLLYLTGSDGDGYALVSVSATDDTPPVYLTPVDNLLWNTWDPGWLSWQSVFP